MADFESNPDIDETPPIPLRDALEKMKPFLMAYEGIQDQEEWEVKQDLTCFSFCHIVFCYINHLLYFVFSQLCLGIFIPFNENLLWDLDYFLILNQFIMVPSASSMVN